MGDKVDASMQQLNAALSSAAISDEQVASLNKFCDDYEDVDEFQDIKAKFENQDLLLSVAKAITASKSATTATALIRVLMMASRHEQAQNKMAKSEILSPILSVMRLYETDWELQENGCHVMCNIATNEKCRKVLSKENVVDVVIDCLRNFSDNQSILLTAVWAMRNLALLDSNKKQLVQKGALDQIVRAMEAAPTLLPLQTQGVMALQTISMQSDSREPILGASGLVPVKGAMFRFPLERRLQEGAVWLIANICDSKNCRQGLRYAEPQEALVAAAENFPDSDLIQKYASSVIATLADLDIYDSEDESLTLGSPSRPDLSTDMSTEPVIPDAEPTILRKGFMQKLGARAKSFKKKWFVLDTRVLSAFRVQDDTAPATNVINLSMACGVIPDTSKKNGIILVTSLHSYRFICANKAEQTEWIDDIKKVIGMVARPADAGGELKTLISELDAIVLEHVSHHLPDTSHGMRVHTSKRPDFTLARTVYHTTKRVRERISEVTMLNAQGNPTDYVDAVRVRSLCDVVLEKAVDAALAEDGDDVKTRPWTAELWSEQGVRESMEDKHLMLTYMNSVTDMKLPGDMSCYGVFDGHGGTLAAEYAATHLYGVLLQELEKNEAAMAGESTEEHDPMYDVITKAFVRTNEMFFESMMRQSTMDACGSTGVIALIRDKRVYIAWCGDSEACIVSTDPEVPPRRLVEPHKAGLQKERERVEALGGVVLGINQPRLNGMLAVTRSFGDARFKRFVIPDPDIISFELQGNEDFMLLGCDGIWDVMDENAIVEYMKEYREQEGNSKNCARAFVNRSLRLGSSDNVSVITLVFDKNK